MSVPEGITYHISICSDKKSVSVSPLGINNIDSELCSYYSCVNDLPDWVQDKLSVLMLLIPPPPANDVAGVGSKVGPYLYWVYE